MSKEQEFSVELVIEEKGLSVELETRLRDAMYPAHGLRQCLEEIDKLRLAAREHEDEIALLRVALIQAEDGFAKSSGLLERASNIWAEVPCCDTAWWPDYFTLTGQHMILTEEGWESGNSKATYLEEYALHPEHGNPILDEING